MIRFAPTRHSSGLRYIVALTLALVSSAHIVGCARGMSDDGAGTTVTATGAFLADGSCQAVVNGTPLFAARDRPRTTYQPGPVANLAPAGYTLHQLTCAPAESGPGAPDRVGERLVLVTLYTREGASLRAGRYTIRPELATADDTMDAPTRAGVAVFGAPTASGTGGVAGAGERYLEGREGTLTITDARGPIAGTFALRAAVAWSM